MQLAKCHRRQAWAILGPALVIAAFLVVAAASFHVKGLPAQPWACDEYECVDPSYDLRAPYAVIARGALLAGIIGMLLLIPARPLLWSRHSGCPRGWSRQLGPDLGAHHPVVVASSTTRQRSRRLARRPPGVTDPSNRRRYGSCDQ